MKKFRFLLLDANVVIWLFELGLWDTVVAKCDILLARSVAENEALYYKAEDRDVKINLTSHNQAHRVTIIDVNASDLKGFYDQFDPTYAKRLDAGEGESLAYLHMSQDPCLICSGDGIVFRVLAALNLIDRGLSLEEVLQGLGISSNMLPNQAGKAFRKKLTDRGKEEAIRGIGKM